MLVSSITHCLLQLGLGFRSLIVSSSSPTLQEAEEEDAESSTPEPKSVCGATQPHAGKRAQPSRARGDSHG